MILAAPAGSGALSSCPCRGDLMRGLWLDSGTASPPARAADRSNVPGMPAAACPVAPRRARTATFIHHRRVCETVRAHPQLAPESRHDGRGTTRSVPVPAGGSMSSWTVPGESPVRQLAHHRAVCLQPHRRPVCRSRTGNQAGSSRPSSAPGPPPCQGSATCSPWRSMPRVSRRWAVGAQAMRPAVATRTSSITRSTCTPSPNSWVVPVPAVPLAQPPSPCTTRARSTRCGARPWRRRLPSACSSRSASGHPSTRVGARPSTAANPSAAALPPCGGWTLPINRSARHPTLTRMWSSSPRRAPVAAVSSRSPRQTPCFPAGTPPLLWEHGTVSPRGTYVWLFWRKRSCCVLPAQASCGITLVGTHGANGCLLPTPPVP